jgi:hypothetical protein
MIAAITPVNSRISVAISEQARATLFRAMRAGRAMRS